MLDVSKSVHKFYGFLDPVSVEILVTEVMVLFSSCYYRLLHNHEIRLY